MSAVGVILLINLIIPIALLLKVCVERGRMIDALRDELYTIKGIKADHPMKVEKEYYKKKGL